MKKAISGFIPLVLASQAQAYDYPVDCAQDPNSLDASISAAMTAAQAGIPSRVFVTGNCNGTLHEMDSPGSFALIGSGSGSASVQIAGFQLLRIVPASGTSDITVRGLTLQGGSGGGAVAAARSSLYVDDVVFTQNNGDFGGGIEGTLLNLTVRRSRFINNTGGRGGGIANPSGFTDVEDCVFDGNVVTDSGGAIYSTAPLRLVTSQITNNQAANFGGGVAQLLEAADIRNVTFFNNSANQGGAISIDSSGSLALHNVTIHANTAPTSGSVLYTTNNSITFVNSLLSGTCAGLNASPTGIGNIESPGNSCALPAGNVVNEPAANLMLGSLAANGGPTQTLLPSPGSVLIDNGSGACEPIDQRRLVRNVGACDVGSVELGATTPDLIFANGLEMP